MTDDGTGEARSPLVTLSFLVHRDFRRRFKRLAVDADITQKELLHRMFDAWEEKRRESPADGAAGGP